MYILYITRPHKHFALKFLSCLIKDVRTTLGDDDEGGGSTLVPNVNFDFRNIMTFNLVLFSKARKLRHEKSPSGLLRDPCRNFENGNSSTFYRYLHGISSHFERHYFKLRF